MSAGLKLFALIAWPFFALLICGMGAVLFVVYWFLIPFAEITRRSDGSIKVKFPWGL